MIETFFIIRPQFDKVFALSQRMLSASDTKDSYEGLKPSNLVPCGNNLGASVMKHVAIDSANHTTVSCTLAEGSTP